MNLDDLLSLPCPWLRGDGEMNDIVISSRIRLARNVIGFPFPIRTAQQDRRLIQETVCRAAAVLFPQDEYGFLDLQTLSPLDRMFLQERQLISPELAMDEQTHAVLIDRLERFGVVINEKDHLQIYSIGSGFVLSKVWEQVDEIDQQFGSQLDYAFHEKYGFLTSSVTNVGTGMKISVMLHLPALMVTHELDKVFRSLQKAQLNIRGLYGEGSQPLGDCFQISNRITLGKSEQELINKMTVLIPQVVSYEQQARDFLRTHRRETIFDRCSRAAGVLRTAQTISHTETMLHLSSLRLGTAMGLLEGIDRTVINTLFLHTQPAHLEKSRDEHQPHVDLEIARAAYIRNTLGTVSLPSGKCGGEGM